MRVDKRVVKSGVDLVMRGASFPLFCLYCIGRYPLGDRKAFSSLMQWVSLLPGVAGEWYRRGVLQWVTGQRMTDACIGFGTLFSDPRVRIGDGVYIGPRCDIGKAVIGRNVIIGSNVQILSGLNQHRFDSENLPIKEQPGEFRKIVIEEDSWIGSQSLVGADIGKRCIIGAGSVVIKPVPDYSIALGNPAKVMRSSNGKKEAAPDA